MSGALVNKENKSIYDCGNGCSLELLTEKEYADFERIVCDSKSAGYEVLQFSEIENFSSVTLLKENEQLIISFDKTSKEIRKISDHFSAQLNTVYSKAGKCPVRLWQFEVDHTLIDCGMCYIIQCTDFSFFVIDSAHSYSVRDDIRLYELLRKETPEELPVVISGWYLSHGHVDHIAKCLDFVRYNDDVTIKGLYYNFVPNNHFSSDCWLVSDKNHTDLFNREIEKRTDIPKYKLHSGQYFYVDCLRMDILCSHECVFPKPLDDYNNSSLMMMLTIGDEKVSFPGDSSGFLSEIIERRYFDFLKCDLMQVSHHGHFGTSVEFYKRSNAKVAMFPVTQIKFDEEYPRYEANRVACELAKHVFIASNGTVMFTFPLKNSDILVYPDETNESFEGVYNLWSYDYSDEFKHNHIEAFKKRNVFKTIPY